MSSAGNSSIDCATARQHLSAYHDGELSPDLRAAMAEHLEGCLECGRWLAEIRELSRMAAELPTPDVPPEIWPHLEKQLDAEARSQAAPYAPPQTIRRRRLWAGLAAAIVLVIVPIGLATWRFYSSDREHGHVAVNFGHYLDEFIQSPDAAEQVLLSNYEGRAVNAEEATSQLRYRPMAPKKLPDGASLEALYLLKMPCCLCVEAVYKGVGGETIAIFEHVDDQPIWFGNRPMVHTRCNGRPTSLVQVDDRLAASWKHQGRFVTVVGAQDVEQVSQLMAFLDAQGVTK